MRWAAVVLGIACAPVATFAAKPPPPPVPLPAREPRPPYEPEGPRAPEPASGPTEPRAASPDVEVAPEPEPEPEPASYARSGFQIVVEATFGDCLGETCANHESGIGFGLGAEVLYRLDMGLAFGLGYWAQGVASDPNSSFSAWDACQPLADAPEDTACDAKWTDSILRYRTYGVVGRWYFSSEDVLDPFVGLVVGSGWFQLWGRFDVNHAYEGRSLGQMSYGLTGPAIGLEAGSDFFVSHSFAVGALLRWTYFAWDTACLAGDLGAEARSRMGLDDRCADPSDFEATGMTDAGTPTALQVLFRGRLSL